MTAPQGDSMGPSEALEPCPSYMSTEPNIPGAEPSPPYIPGAEPSPPSYSSSVATTVDNGILPPETLLLTGTTIHRTSVSSPRIYELSHHIGLLSDFSRTVTLCRVDYRTRSASLAASPDIVGRPKPIFTLNRPPPITTTSFEYYLDSTSRGNLGDVGLEPYRHLRSSGYRAYLAARPSERADLEATDLLFVASARGHGRYDWRDGADEGRVLAYESNEPEGSRLQIVVGMRRGRRDALVGSWCLRLWHEIVDSGPRPLLRSRHRGI